MLVAQHALGFQEPPCTFDGLACKVPAPAPASPLTAKILRQRIHPGGNRETLFELWALIKLHRIHPGHQIKLGHVPLLPF